MITNSPHHMLEQLLGTVANAMHADVLILDVDTQPMSPPAAWSELACPAPR